MDQRIQSVVILGGGTSGWMTASYLAKALQGSVNITVLEAPSIPKIGVGKGTSYARPLEGSTGHYHHPFGLLPDHEHLPLSRY
jgi:tryptophan halogenase